VAPPTHDVYPDLPDTASTVGGQFDLSSQGYQLTINGSMTYVQGWIQYLIALGSTVPAATGGSAGVNFGPPPASGGPTFSGSDWRFAQQSTSSPSGYTFWNGSAWQNVPPAWSDPTSTLLYPIGIWAEGSVNKAQVGNTWPATVPAWGAAEQATCASVLPTWVNTIQTVWSGRFNLKRDQCPSSDPSCCRYLTQATVSFTLVSAVTNTTTIVLAPNDARSNAGAWSMGDNRATMPAHEFGHHLGNPDEYAGGVGVDPSVNDDGATNGIDPDSIMGQNMVEVKKRHYNTICKQLSAMVDTASAQSNGFTYQAIPT
jgi:hypothetical protein